MTAHGRSDFVSAAGVGVAGGALAALAGFELRRYWPDAELEPSLGFLAVLASYALVAASAVASSILRRRAWIGALVGFVLGTSLWPLSGIPRGWAAVLATPDALSQLGVAFMGVLAYAGAISCGFYAGAWLAAACFVAGKRAARPSRSSLTALLALSLGGLMIASIALTTLCVFVPTGVQAVTAPNHFVRWLLLALASGTGLCVALLVMVRRQRH